MNGHDNLKGKYIMYFLKNIWNTAGVLGGNKKEWVTSEVARIRNQ